MKNLLHFFLGAMLLVLASLGHAANADDYLLGAGDVVRITVYDHPDLLLDVQVGDDGDISYPLLGPVLVKGKSIGDVERDIAAGLVAGKYLKDAHVSLQVMTYRSMRISVIGEVNRPIHQFLDSKYTLLDALALAGGVAQTGGDKVILLRTVNGKVERREYSLTNILAHPDLDIVSAALQTNDVIFVPKGQRFYVYGEVKNPGPFVLDRSMSVLQALSMAGGATPRATHSSPTVFRRDADGKTTEIKADPTDAVQDGDVVYLKESLF